MKEAEGKALNGFTALSSEELESVDGGGKFSLIGNGISYSTGSWDMSVTASGNVGMASTWHSPSISSGNGSIISATCGPVYGRVDSISVGITYHY